MLEKFSGSRELSSAPSCCTDFTGKFGLTTKVTKSTKFKSKHYSDLRVLRAFVVKFSFLVSLRRAALGSWQLNHAEYPILHYSNTPSLQFPELHYSITPI
jgi:hypothetical protein